MCECFKSLVFLQYFSKFDIVIMLDFWLVKFLYTIIKPTMIMIVGFNSGGTTISLGKIRDLW